jgi:putative CocE/NonD family hydrolase
MDEWFSGAIPYQWLLFSQFLIILLYGKICIDFTSGSGYFVRPNRTLGSGLLQFGMVYFAVMVIRYVIRMTLYPHERWTGGSIPIFFHWVLASFLLLVGTYHRARARQQSPEQRSLPRAISWRARAMQGIGILLVLASILAWVCYQLAPWALARRLGFRPVEFAVRIERGAKMATSDGIALVADIYHPRRVGRTPTILVRIPYSKTLKNKLFATIVGRMWAEHGYTVVIQGTRGRYQSSGTYYPLRGERQDGIETLAWVAKEPWFDGRLGMWGGSAFGYTEWAVADQTNPGPSALIIWQASTDFHGMFYPGGAFSLESALCWAVRSRGPQDRDDWPTADELRPGYQGFPLIEADDRVVGDIPFFDDWVSHRERNAYWREIDGENRPAELKAPALLMAGWYDPFLPTQINDFLRIRRHAKSEIASKTQLIIGPWVHASEVTFPGGFKPRNFRLESFAPSIPWFDRHLSSSDDSSHQDTPVRIFVMGKNLWREEQAWPPARIRYTSYYLHSGGRANSAAGDGQLSTVPPSLQEAADSYTYDPRNPVPTVGGAMMGPRAGIARQNAVEARPDVLVYTTPPLEEEVEVTGPISLILYVSTTTASTDFTGKLVDVYPDGSAYNVSEGILRRGYRSNSKEPTEIRIDLWPTSMVSLRGHRIRLEVSSSNYPRFDRNPNTGREIATEMHPIKALQTVYHVPASASRLILPIIANGTPGE